MPSTPSDPATRLASHDDRAWLNAPEAIVKTLLESDIATSVFAGPRREPLAAMFRLGHDEAVAALLRRHDFRLIATDTATRGFEIATHVVRSGGAAVAWAPAEEIANTASVVAEVARTRLPRGAAITLLLEDRPDRPQASSPYDIARRLDLPALVPRDLAQLRAALDTALRLSRAASRPMTLIVHRTILLSAATVPCRPNRVIESVDAMLARRRRRRVPRLAETEDVLRLVRRLELNETHAIPSPGERAVVGFVAIGPAAAALDHLADTLRLAGRVPVLQLAAVQPVDETATRRLLARCETVIVLEPRPGTVEAEVVEIAEAMRHEGLTPGAVWGNTVPPADDTPVTPLSADEVVHPSRLARRIIHVLHAIRPGGRVAAQLVPEPPAGFHAVPPRGVTTGMTAALAMVREVVVEVDQRLREREVDPREETAVVATGLAIDGVSPDPAPPRVVTVEVWDGVRFRAEAVAAVRQAAREDRPWIIIVVDLGDLDGLDLDRFARGMIPADRAARVDIDVVELGERGMFVERIHDAALTDRLTILVARDTPTPQFSPTALDRELAEIDRLGFEPRQRRRHAADFACAVRPPLGEERLAFPSVDPVLPSASLRFERVATRSRRRLNVKVWAQAEDIEVVRTRPPIRRWRDDDEMRLPLPQIVHAAAGLWRVHLAGYRGPGLGFAGRVLAGAGVRMGYQVAGIHEPAPLGAGRRAWTQLLFTRPRPGETPRPLTARTPFGEADLLLGLDVSETLRAVASDDGLRVAFGARTHAIVNTGRTPDEPDTEAARTLRDDLGPVLRAMSVTPTRLTGDFASACRYWFHTDRVTDLALLGAAFQRGVIPVTVSAIEEALREAESGGAGRAMEAFQFGRWLAEHPTLFLRPRETEDDEPLEHLARRLPRLARPRWGGRAATRRFGQRLADALTTMPALAESVAGREAQRDFVVAMYRVFRWGGLEYAERYSRLITNLYTADRAHTGRALTRCAVLPLAGAMLVRDPIFVASMLTSGEQRQRIRHMLSVKRARGDELRRRLSTRVDISVMKWTLRAHVRTSDGPAFALAALRPLVPMRWRGSRRERALRTYLMDLVDRAGRESDADYERYQNALMRLHQQAVDDRLRGMALAEVKMLAEGA